MIAVDTNVVVRLLTKDDQTQFRKAVRLFNEEQLFIPDSVILETEWVLRFAYRFSTSNIASALRKLLGLANVQVDNSKKIAKAIEGMNKG